MTSSANIEAARARAAELVRQRLGFETLLTRGRDALDFRAVSVASVRAAIDIAFEAGLIAAAESKDHEAAALEAARAALVKAGQR